MRKTIQERLIAALTAQGAKEVRSKIRKYRILMRNDQEF